MFRNISTHLVITICMISLQIYNCFGYNRNRFGYNRNPTEEHEQLFADFFQVLKFMNIKGNKENR
jgi:hypothetical protein